MADHEDLHDDPFGGDPLEAYCVKCKETVEMEEPQPVWTRKGAPGTRGFCPVCGTTVFRMGRTEAHRNLRKPNAVKVTEAPAGSRQRRPGRAGSATYINYTDADAVFVHRLADDLRNMGVPNWVPRQANGDIAWAGGVHPALEDCTQMLVVLSPQAVADETVQQAWRFFRDRRKRIVVVCRGAVRVPDDLRRAPRVDFSGEYRPALRELVLALAE